jgi:hypothetical protein
MRILFAAYCLVNDINGNSLIGVYKRCLRIGLDMQARGHDVWILCPDRSAYRDELTDMAEQRLNFLELLPKIMYQTPIEVRRQWCRVAFRRLKLDLVVAGEAPLGGIILEPVLWAASTGVPVAILDNAYGSEFARRFVDAHGPIADAVILSGPSSFQIPDPPSFYCGVPPYLEGDQAEAQELLGDTGASPLITVLGYDQKAEQLAAGLLVGLASHPEFRDRPTRAIFFSPDPQSCKERLARQGLESPSVMVLPPPGENLLFGTLSVADLVVGKCGFMQITECLSVGTPFIGVHYRGCCPMFLIPENARPFVHAVYANDAGETGPDDLDVQVAARLLQVPRAQIACLHNGRFGARRIVSEFLEKLPKEPRAETTDESAAMGYTVQILRSAILSQHRGDDVRIRSIRACRLRDEPWGHIDAVVCRYWIRERSWCSNWWGRVYDSNSAGQREVEALENGLAGRKLIYASDDAQVLVEEMGDESLLPPLRL